MNGRKVLLADSENPKIKIIDKIFYFTAGFPIGSGAALVVMALFRRTILQSMHARPELYYELLGALIAAGVMGGILAQRSKA